MREPTLWDMHVHLDFMRGCRQVAQDAAGLGLGLFATTVTPQGFEQTQRELCTCENVRVGVGLHPWWVADGRCDDASVAQACEYVRSARFVGEIGLDLSPHHIPEGSLDQQARALEQLCDACAQTSDPAAPKLLSLHSVRAAGLTLDILARTGALSTCNCVFHWFSGTSDELSRAVKAGCWFSINEMMLRTRRGREYARQLPAKRLLLETDLPPGEDIPFAAADIVASLERTAAQVALIRGTDQASIEQLTTQNARKLVG